MTESGRRTEHISWVTKLAYGAGDTGTAAAAAIRSFFLLYFLTDVAGLGVALASVVVLVNKIWDAVNDPLVGMISDRVHTRWGRRRPWFLIGAIPFGLSFFLLFRVPELSVMGKFWYYIVVSLLFDLTYTICNVPYGALAPELTRDYDERTSLNQFRFAFSIGFGLAAAVSHQMIVDLVKKSAGVEMGYMVSTLLWAVVGLLGFIFAFAGTYERYEPERKEEEIPFLEGLRTVFQNRAFRIVAGVYMLSWMAVQTVSTVIVYYMTYWLGRPGQTSLVILSVQGSALLWLIVWSRLSRKWGKKEVFLRGMGFWIVVSLALFFVSPEWPVWVAPLLGVLAGGGVAIAYLLPWAMLPDVIEMDELETGRRREGVFYGFFVLIQKLGVALGLFFIGQALSLAGYISPPAGATSQVVQPESALLVIRLFIGPIPVVLLIGSMILVRYFPITRETHAQHVRELEERRNILPR